MSRTSACSQSQIYGYEKAEMEKTVNFSVATVQPAAVRSLTMQHVLMQ